MKGIDISKWNGKIDFEKVKNSGIDFAIIRCGFGKDKSQKDTMFEEYYRECRRVGIKLGTYLYSYVTTPENALLEARNCLEFIKDKQFEMGVYYDIEDIKSLPMGRNGITKSCQIFCEEIEKNGYKAGVYSSLFWFNNYMNVEGIKQYRIWLAQWANKATAKFKIDMWQYTNQATFNGINGHVDADESFFDNELTEGQRKSNNEIAEEVIKGLWGNQPERQTKLENAGYNYQEIQKIVNNKLEHTDNNEIIYIVKEGDNLTKIARKYKTTIKKLVQDNNIKDKNLIRVGQKIIIRSN